MTNIFERIPATMENIDKLKGMWGNPLVHGDFTHAFSGKSYCDIEFPNAYRALHFRESMRDMWSITLRDDSISNIDAPVVMTVELD